MRKIPQDVISLYDAFTHGLIGRRDFMSQLARLAGGTAAASALLPLLSNDYARASITQEHDERLEIFSREFDVSAATPDGNEGAAIIAAYGARLAGRAGSPAAIVIHENRGLNPHIKDIARRLALEGFCAFAVDMLSLSGGTPGDEDLARSMIRDLDRERAARQLAAIASELKSDGDGGRKVGAVGFCWGGGMVNALAARAAALDAGVIFYGMQASADEARAIRADLQFHYAGEDQRINAGIDSYEAALAGAGVNFETHLYENAQHAFNNDTNEARYNEEAAALAWSRTIAFLKDRLDA